MKHNKTKYSNYVNGIPTFEPNDENTTLADCVNVDKYVELLNEVESAYKSGKISQDEYRFLKLAASRWLKFNYANVAQYFCKKASPAMQELLQRSVMVLLDIDDAFKNEAIRAKSYVSSLQKEFIKNRTADLSDDFSEFDDMPELAKYDVDPDDLCRDDVIDEGTLEND